MSAESCDEFAVQHRYDSDSSQAIATHTHNSVVSPSEKCRHSLPPMSGTGLMKTTEGDTAFHHGHTRSKEIGTSDEGSNGVRCNNCGCARVALSMSNDERMVSTNHVVNDTVTPEPRQTQGSVATHDLNVAGHDIQCSAAVSHSRSSVQNTSASKGDNGTHRLKHGTHVNKTHDEMHTAEPKSGDHHLSDAFEMESYNGVVSRELCQQVMRLLTDLEASRNLNIEVWTASMLEIL